MEEPSKGPAESSPEDIRTIVRGAIQEFIHLEKTKAEPAYKAELLEERKRRESLEHRVNDLVEENRRSRQMTEELERASVVRGELQRLGVTKVDLAFKAVKDDIRRAEDGQLVARGVEGETSVRDYLSHFVSENPEFLPARIAGGSGIGPASKAIQPASTSFDMDKIRPGMSADELERARQEISRVAQQALRGQ